MALDALTQRVSYLEGQINVILDRFDYLTEFYLLIASALLGLAYIVMRGRK